MPKYIANPVVVDAYKITEVFNAPTSKLSTPVGAKICVRLENGEEKYPDDGMTARYTPKPGDYWVIQSDGYIYINPKDVFLRKYSLQEESNAA